MTFINLQHYHLCTAAFGRVLNKAVCYVIITCTNLKLQKQSMYIKLKACWGGQFPVEKSICKHMLRKQEQSL